MTRTRAAQAASLNASAGATCADESGPQGYEPTAVRVDRTGKVWRGDVLLGWVDRWDWTDPNRTWRYINAAGRTSLGRYPSRAAAVEALVGVA